MASMLSRIEWPEVSRVPSDYHVSQKNVGASRPVFFRYKALRVPEIMSGLCPLSSKEYQKRDFNISFNFDCLSGILTRELARDRLEYWRSRYPAIQTSRIWRDAHRAVDAIFSLHAGMPKHEICRRLQAQPTFINISVDKISVCHINVYIHGDLLDLIPYQRQKYIDESIQLNAAVLRNNPATTLPEYKDLLVSKLLASSRAKEVAPKQIAPQAAEQPSTAVVVKEEDPMDIPEEYMEIPPIYYRLRSLAGATCETGTQTLENQNSMQPTNVSVLQVSRTFAEQSTQTIADNAPPTQSQRLLTSSTPRPIFGQSGFTSYVGASPYLRLGPSPGERQFKNLEQQQTSARDLFAQVELALSSDQVREGDTRDADSLKRKMVRDSHSSPGQSLQARPVLVDKENPKKLRTQ